MKLSSLIAIGLLTSCLAQAQFSPEKKLPSPDYSEPYLFPVYPGQQNWLAGTMGELRNTHFHSGIDIRTNNMIGAPVLATQQGYISYAIVSATGYGNALFITHPDGNMSVYGHLDHFNGKIAEYILHKQYEQKSFELKLNIPPQLYSVSRGDTIAFSGNTGGSSGPHLHFEIRDRNNEAFNPLAFRFDEIKDVLPPTAQKIALKTMDIDSRINGRFGRFEFSLLRNGSTYFLPYPIYAQGKIGVELLAYDRLDFSQFRCGINQIEMKVDSQRIFTQQIDKINFNESQNIVALMNFQTLKTRGLRFNKLYVQDGNPLNYYDANSTQGVVSITDKPASVEILLRDTYSNESKINFKLSQEKAFKEPVIALQSKAVEFNLSENVMTVQLRSCGSSTIKLFEKGIPQELERAYEANGQQVFLVDLHKIIPDSMATCHGIFSPHVVDAIPSKTEYTFYSDLADIRFHANTLYDTLYLSLEKNLKNNREVFSIGKNTDPLREPLEITLKQAGAAGSKNSVYRMEGRQYEFVGGQWQHNNITFYTKELGDFVVLSDSIAPGIYRIRCNNYSARFRISDNLSGIGNYEATVNGQWLMMKYDYKTGILQSEPLDKTQLLKGDFELKVTDRAGNEKIYRQKIL
ncbi:MAG: M23 family metallopeptidase [Bacteroidetes bacterium]|nr:M23 family metallopeptidase [Bacteroidota bacterium]